MEKVAELGSVDFLDNFSWSKILVMYVNASVLDKNLVLRLLMWPLTSVLMGAKLFLPRKSGIRNKIENELCDLH